MNCISNIHAGGYAIDRRNERSRFWKKITSIIQNQKLSSGEKKQAKKQAFSVYQKSKKESLTKLY